MPGNLTKLSNTPVFTGYLPAAERTDGLNQTGSWFQNDPATSTGPYKTNLVEAIPAAVRVVLSGSPALQQFAPGVYRATLSLSGQNGQPMTLQLTASTSDAFNNPSSAVLPNQQRFTFLSHNARIATVNSTGLVTPSGRIGEVDIECQYPRSVNLQADGLVPTVGTESVYAIVSVKILP
jgi:hypothetical protein